MNLKTTVIIPAYNEANSIGKVLNEIPDFIYQTVVVNNGSTDDTQKIAEEHGAIVIDQPERGYGNACLSGVNHLSTSPPDIVVFIDADYSDYPDQMTRLVTPIIEDKADFVVGTRKKNLAGPGSFTIPQIFGNWLATRLMYLLYNSKFTDLGPFRAIRWQTLNEYNMKDRDYGWTVEMQLKALHHKTRYIEIDVPYRKRIGKSKISGTVKGTLSAGFKILYWIGKFYFSKK